MNEMQHIAFWAWWETGFNGHGERSFSKAAKKLGFSPDTLSKWHKEFHWDTIAAEKDAKTNRKMERIVIEKVVKTFSKALERQQIIIGEVFNGFLKALPHIPCDKWKIADIVKLMEFETGWVYDEERAGQGNQDSLAAVLRMMTPEQRTEFNATIERARDCGAIDFAEYGPPQRG